MNIDEIELAAGPHSSPDEGMCAMEAVAYIAGEPFSDHPECACPVISIFMRYWNDSLSDDDRNRLLKPLIPKIVGTRSTDDVGERRGWLAMDWLARVLTPAFLDLTPSLASHAGSLRALTPLSRVSMDVIEALSAADSAADSAALSVADSAADSAARAAARAAARVAARAAAGVAAYSAALSAADSAAYSAALSAADSAADSAARAAARAAAGAAADSAARAAARAAARNAAYSALRSTVEALQASAVDLVERMVAESP